MTNEERREDSELENEAPEIEEADEQEENDGDETGIIGEPQERDRRLGWVPDVPDIRDHHFSLSQRIVGQQIEVPTSLRLQDSPFMPPVWDQREMGSCTGQGVAATIMFDRAKDGQPPLSPSRLQLYYNGRIPLGTTGVDSGAMIRDVIKGAAQFGAADEKYWPYTESRLLKPPNKRAIQYGKRRVVTEYLRVDQTEEAIIMALASQHLITFGFMVYDSFMSRETARTGVARMPQPGERAQGGHAVVLCGYERAARIFHVRNSWGTDWGMNGYFTMPMEYVLNNRLSDDFWITIASK